MMEVDRIRKKLFDLPVLFKHYFRNKEYSKAKSTYDTARTVAVFLEMEEKDMVRLFGSRPYNDTNPPTDGEFRESEVDKAYWECIKNNLTYELKPYPGPPGQKNSL